MDDEREAPPNPLCVYCNAPWDEPMMLDLYTSEGCPTCGHGARTTFTIKINCSSCGRLVYRKEVEE